MIIRACNGAANHGPADTAKDGAFCFFVAAGHHIAEQSACNPADHGTFCGVGVVLPLTCRIIGLSASITSGCERRAGNHGRQAEEHRLFQHFSRPFHCTRRPLRASTLSASVTSVTPYT